jgi:hypothetical protein
MKSMQQISLEDAIKGAGRDPRSRALLFRDLSRHVASPAFTAAFDNGLVTAVSLRNARVVPGQGGRLKEVSFDSASKFYPKFEDRFALLHTKLWSDTLGPLAGQLARNGSDIAKSGALKMYRAGFEYAFGAAAVNGAMSREVGNERDAFVEKLAPAIQAFGVPLDQLQFTWDGTTLSYKRSACDLQWMPESDDSPGSKCKSCPKLNESVRHDAFKPLFDAEPLTLG